MKKIKYIILLCTSVFLLSGCVKFNANMDIKKNKSMNFSIIYAINSSMLDDQELLTDEDKKNLEKQGFIIDDYNEDNMKGFKITKKIKNIDYISSKDDIEYSLSGISNDTSEKNYMFKVEKGFFKNTYTANFKFDTSDSGLSDDLQDPSLDYDYDLDNPYEEFDQSINDDTDFLDTNDSDIDFTELMGDIDLSFNVTLPYKAISNNASKTENNNKSLSWNLSSDKAENIEFKFELYNMTNIYICIGIGILIIGAVVAITIIIKNKGNKKDKNNSSNTQINQPINQNPTYQQPIVNPINTQTNTINNENISSSTPLNNTNQVPNINTNNLNTIPEQQNTNTTDIFNTSVNQTSTPNINNQNNNPFNNGTM